MPDLTKIAAIDGMQIQAYASIPNGLPDRVKVSEGFCFLPSNRRLMFDGSDSVFAPVPTGLTDTWLHLYALAAGSNMGALEIATVDAPAAPYRGTARCKPGDVTRRYIGSGRIEASGRLRAGRHLTTGSKGNRVLLTQAQGTLPTASNLAITLLGGVPGIQSANMSAFVPQTATAATVVINNTTALWFYVGRPSMGALTNLVHDVAIQPNSMVEVDLLLDSDLTLTYQASTTGLLGGVVSIGAGNFTIRPRGYLFDR